MVITELTDRRAAAAFAQALTMGSAGGATERPYAAHVVFLATGLDISHATALLQAVRDVDVVTGPYLAAHMVVDKIRVATRRRLIGLPDRWDEHLELCPRQIEGLVQHQELNHMQLEDLAPTALTAASSDLARDLGVIDKLPCVVVLDAREISTSGEMLVVPFPPNGQDLAKLIHSLVNAVLGSKGELQKCASALERIHALFEERQRLLSQRGAPIARKLPVLKTILLNLSDDATQALRDLKRVRAIVGQREILSDRQIRSLTLITDPVLSEARANGTLTAEVAKERALAIREAFEIVTERETGLDVGDYVTELRQLHGVAIARVLDLTATQDDAISAAVRRCEQEIIAQRDLLRSDVSVAKLIANDAAKERWSVIRKDVRTIAQSALKTGLSDVAKPSFWLKIFGF
jgi:hypothetical protein